MRHQLLRAAVALSILFSACSDSNADADNVADAPSNRTAGQLLRVQDINVPDGLGAAANAQLFEYSMDSVTGEMTTAKAQLFEPRGTAPTGGFALVVWAHGTTGIAESCAPSSDFDSLGNEFAVNALLSAGYAVLIPDYEGFGTTTIHPYYVRSSHANSVLDAVPAVHQIENATVSDEWALVGHSQGGHVALASARADGDPTYPLVAVVALAPGTDAAPLSDFIFDAIGQDVANSDLDTAAERTFYINVYSAFVAHAAQLVLPEFVPQHLFGDTVAGLIDIALDEPHCGDYANAINAALVDHLRAGGTLAEFKGLQREWLDTSPELADLLESEELNDEPQAMPLLIVQGDADTQIPVAATTAFVDKQRSVNTDVTYQIVVGGSHFDVARTEFDRTINWLGERFPAR